MVTNGAHGKQGYGIQEQRGQQSYQYQTLQQFQAQVPNQQKKNNDLESLVTKLIEFQLEPNKEFSSFMAQTEIFMAKTVWFMVKIDN